MKPIIELEGVSKVYKMGEVEVNALKNVSLQIKEGEFVALMGPSGSGKSTMMNMIGCLDIPTNGKVFLDGQDISKMSESKLARLRGDKIGFIFQFFNLYPSLSVQGNIELPMRIHDYNEKEIRKKSLQLLKIIDMEAWHNHLPSQLSGGQMQRVSIARALSTDPSIILADEPTGNIDSRNAGEIMKFLEKLHKEKKETIIIVTHDINVAKYAQRIIHLKDGQIQKGG
jgi:putative ABC transport system ATP-binding protein